MFKTIQTFPKYIFKQLYKCLKQIISLFIIAFLLNLLPRFNNIKYIFFLIIGIICSLIIRLNLLHKFNIDLPEIYLLIINLFSVLYACYLLYLYVIISTHAYKLFFKFKNLYKHPDKHLNILYISIIYYTYYIYISVITLFIIYINYLNIKNIFLFEYFYSLVLLISFLFAFDYSIYNINLNYKFNRNISNLGIIFFVSIILIYFGYLYSIYNGFLFKILQKFNIFGTIHCDTPSSKKALNIINDNLRGPNSNSDNSVTLHSTELQTSNNEELQVSRKKKILNEYKQNHHIFSDQSLINLLEQMSVDISNPGLTKLHLIFIKTIHPLEIQTINVDITQDNFSKFSNKYHHNFILYLSKNLNLLDDKIINKNTKIDLLDNIRLLRANNIISKDQRLNNLTYNLIKQIKDIFSLSLSTFNTLNTSTNKSLVINKLNKIQSNTHTTLIKNKDGSYMKYIPLNRKINFNNIVNVNKLLNLYTRNNNIFVSILPGNSGIYAYHEQGLRIFFPSKQFKSNMGGWCSIFNENQIMRYYHLKQAYILRISDIENLSNLYQQAKYLDKNGNTIIKYQDNIPYKSEFNENKFIYKQDSFEFLSDAGGIIRIPIPKTAEKLTQFGLSKVQLLIKYFPFDPIIPGDNSTLKDNLNLILQKQWNIKPKFFFFEKFNKNEGFWLNMDFLMTYTNLLSTEEFMKVSEYLSNFIIKQYPINKELMGKYSLLENILDNNSIILMNNIAEIRVLNYNKNDFYTISIPFNSLDEISKKIQMELLILNYNLPPNLDKNTYLANFSKGLYNFNKILKKNT